jgi:hypothetical protein
MNPIIYPKNRNYRIYELLLEKKIVFAIWIIITLSFVIDSWISDRMNNYLIFENTFRNLINDRSLYALYPSFHDDANHYGPIFTLIIAPFSLLPNWLGLLFWNLFNCLVLFKAMNTLPVNDRDKCMIYYIAIPCLIESMLNQQFNPVAGALIILNYTMLNRNGGFFSALFMVLGIFIKLYGIVGLAFFFFVKNKPKFILYTIFWSIVFFVLPMLFASPTFVAGSYLDWLASLTEKNMANVSGNGRDISIMGFFRDLGIPLTNLEWIATGAMLFLIPFLNPGLYKKENLQILILASALIFPILFSTGAEDCTFIISATGVGIWYLLEPEKPIKNFLLPALLVLACNFPLLLFPKFAKSHMILQSMLSFPYFLVWIRILYCATMGKIAVLPKARQIQSFFGATQS